MKSIDRGYTWDTVYPTGTATIFGSFLELNGKYFSGGNDYIGGEDNGFFRSLDSGDTWELISMQGFGITKLAKDLDNNIIAGVVSSPAGQHIGLYKSTDAGISWTQLFDQQQVTEVAVDSTGGYYIGLDSWSGGLWGVYYSCDSGDSWQELNSGILQANVIHDLDINAYYAYCLVLNYKAEKVLYRSRNPIVSINENIVGDGDYLHLYPNPIRNSQNLMIRNTSEDEYHINIHDGRGNLILDGINIPDNSEIVIRDGYKWIPGIYFVMFFNNTNSFAKKVIITK